jgi:SH3-like domain-containing protein
MGRVRFGWLLVAGALALPIEAAAASTYREVAVAAAVLYDAPSDKANKRFIVTESTPLEVLSTLPPWTKVRDVDGSVNWIRASELGEAMHLIATAVATVRAGPSEAAAVRFRVARGVLLERLAEARDGWVEVRHQGTTGFVRTEEVWGL